MKRKRTWVTVAILCVLLGTAALVVRSRFERELSVALARASQGSEVIWTRCGPIEVQQAGEGIALLMVHGSGGGHDQGMAWARPLALQGVRVIAMSRFGYLRTPRPEDASPEAQADAHVCVLDALGVGKAAVMGVSAGGPSALQTAIRHPDRVSARVNDIAERILPVSARAAGLRDDTRLGKRLGPYALEALRVPTLIVSARDDGFGTFAGAQYTASRIPGARFLGFDRGGHLLVGHDAQVQAEVLALLKR